MKASRLPRKTANLSASIDQQLSKYALAAGAAGIGMLAFAQPSEAKIVYTPAHKHLPLNHPFYLDLNHDGVADFRFFLGWNTQSGQSIVGLLVYPSQQGNGIWRSNSQGVSCAAALPRGTKIGPKGPFSQRPLSMFGGAHTNSSTFCPWHTSGKKQAYLGLRFSFKGKVHFGWARFITHSRPHPTAELTGYAYETIPGKSIIAGATKGPDNIEPTTSFATPTPHPLTLGALAMGAPGLAIWRRKESAAAALTAS